MYIKSSVSSSVLSQDTLISGVVLNPDQTLLSIAQTLKAILYVLSILNIFVAVVAVPTAVLLDSTLANLKFLSVVAGTSFPHFQGFVQTMIPGEFPFFFLGLLGDLPDKLRNSLGKECLPPAQYANQHFYCSVSQTLLSNLILAAAIVCGVVLVKLWQFKRKLGRTYTQVPGNPDRAVEEAPSQNWILSLLKNILASLPRILVAKIHASQLMLWTLVCLFFQNASVAVSTSAVIGVLFLLLGLLVVAWILYLPLRKNHDAAYKLKFYQDMVASPQELGDVLRCAYLPLQICEEQKTHWIPFAQLVLVMCSSGFLVSWESAVFSKVAVALLLVQCLGLSVANVRMKFQQLRELRQQHVSRSESQSDRQHEAQSDPQPKPKPISAIVDLISPSFGVEVSFQLSQVFLFVICMLPYTESSDTLLYWFASCYTVLAIIRELIVLLNIWRYQFRMATSIVTNSQIIDPDTKRLGQT